MSICPKCGSSETSGISLFREECEKCGHEWTVTYKDLEEKYKRKPHSNDDRSDGYPDDYE